MKKYNQVTIIGTINSELGMVEINDKDKMELNYTIAVDRPYPDMNKSDTFNITCRGELADLSNRYLETGDKILVDGYLTTLMDCGELQTFIVAQKIQFMDTKKSKSISDSDDWLLQ